MLKEAILAFDGTVIVVSHDRDFLNGLVTKVYEFGGGLVREHIGGIYDFLQKKEIESLDALQSTRMDSTGSPSASKVAATAQTSECKLNYEERKEQAKIRRKAEKRVEQCEQRVMELEEKKADIEAQLATPEGAADADLFSRYAEIQSQLKAAESEWEEALAALEE